MCLSFSGVQVSDDEIADATITAMSQAVPPAVPGIVFLSGGMSPEQATARLDAMNKRGPQPWQLGFSFARALQGPVMSTWAGDDANRDAAQDVFLHRARLTSAARRGKYSRDMERAA